ncbi:LysR family transcriptional regulator, partial [Rhizobiaceae sp. 2RAB30]
MDVNLALRAFVRTVEKGSVTGAARDLGISQPAVTKHLRNLERHVNARLLERTTRAVRPTAHGLTLYDVSRTALASIDAAMEGVHHDMGEIEGALRIHAPSCIGAQHLHGMVMEFQNQHPAVTVDLVLDNRQVDLVYENFDLAVQYGKPEQQELIIRRFGSIRRILVASPEYLKRVGPIDSLDRLSHANMITTTTILSPQDMLILCREGAMTEVPVRPSLRTNNA